MYRTINSTHKEQSFKHSQYLRLATIGIENPHGIISAVNTRHCKYNSISTNPKVPITQLHRLLRRNPRLWRIPIIYLFENHQSILNLNPKKNLKFFFFPMLFIPKWSRCRGRGTWRSEGSQPLVGQETTSEQSRPSVELGCSWKKQQTLKCET